MQYLKNVSTLNLHADLCTGCGMCMKVCPHAVFKLTNGKAQIIDIDDCMECGACVLNCSFGAIAVNKGVGCVTGIINGILTNSEPTCC